MAGGTGVRHAREANDFLGKPNGHLLSLFPIDSKRSIPTRSWEFVRKHAWQHMPDPVGNAGIMFSTNRAVLEAHVWIGGDPVWLWFFPEEFIPPDEGPKSDHDNQECDNGDLQFFVTTGLGLSHDEFSNIRASRKQFN
jgi:hypothetical protein